MNWLTYYFKLLVTCTLGMLLRFSALIQVGIRALKRNNVPNTSLNYVTS